MLILGRFGVGLTAFDSPLRSPEIDIIQRYCDLATKVK
jgi:hypothetical protein